MDRILRNARLADGSAVDIVISGGLITEVRATGPTPREGVDVHDLGGRLVLPALAEPHAHLDKALTAETVPNVTGDLMGAIEAQTAAMQNGMFTYDDVVDRATRALELLLVHGTTAVRSHVDVGAGLGATWVQAVHEARSRFVGLMDVQIVALMYGPLPGDEGVKNRAMLSAALAAGADLVGGCPALESDSAGQIRELLAAATDAGLGVDLHVDETLDASMLTLRELARQVRTTGFVHPVAASHCVSLAMQTREVQEAVASEVAAAGIAVIPLPQTNLFLQGRGLASPMPRAIAPVDILRRAGVLVAAGGDNVQDPFNPVGRSDPLETAALLVMASHQLPDAAYGMVSNDVRRVMGLPVVTMKPGDPADLLVIDAPSVRGAIADASPSRRVYHRGRLVASSTLTTTIGVESTVHNRFFDSNPRL